MPAGQGLLWVFPGERGCWACDALALPLAPPQKSSYDTIAEPHQQYRRAYDALMSLSGFGGGSLPGESSLSSHVLEDLLSHIADMVRWAWRSGLVPGGFSAGRTVFLWVYMGPPPPDPRGCFFARCAAVRK